MDALTGPAATASALLMLAGAQKVIDPTMTVGALRAMRVPASDTAVRIGSAAELLVGVAALAWGTSTTWVLPGLSYLAFTIFVGLAMRKGTMIGTCGCFGRDETPPHWLHVALNMVLTGVAFAAAVDPPGTLLDAGASGEAIVVVLLVALALFLLHAAYVHLPRTLTAGRSAESGAL